MYGGQYKSQLATIRPLAVRNMTSETIPGFACMMRYKAYDENEINGRGTENVDGVETWRVEKCNEEGAQRQDAFNFIFNGPTPIPPYPYGFGTGTQDFPAMVLHEPATNLLGGTAGLQEGGEWLFPNEGCGPVADQWFVTHKYYRPGNRYQRGVSNWDDIEHPQGWMFRSLGHLNTWGGGKPNGQTGNTGQAEDHPIWVTNQRVDPMPAYLFSGDNGVSFSIDADKYFTVGGATGRLNSGIFVWQRQGQNGPDNWYTLSVDRNVVLSVHFHATIVSMDPVRGDMLWVAVEHWRPAKSSSETSNQLPENGGPGSMVSSTSAYREQDVEVDGYHQNIQNGKENVACSAVFAMKYNDRIYIRNKSQKRVGFGLATISMAELYSRVPYHPTIRG